MKIAVTGATGFIGRRLIETLLEKSSHEIVGFGRRDFESSLNRFTYRKVDFFSPLQAESALEGCDVAIYLLHSMSPSSRLSQGSFSEFDYLLADNFAKSAESCGVKKIIYVSGIIDEDKKDLSEHLKSRIEVENIFLAYKPTPIVLRCSLVIGSDGSSFVILKKLVKRLRVMTLPLWSYNLCQPIYVDDLIEVISKCISEPIVNGKVYDCASNETVTYAGLIAKVSKAFGIQNYLIKVPFIPLMLSKFWVMLITGSSKELVYPLIDSLDMNMISSPKNKLDRVLEANWTKLDDALHFSLNDNIKRKAILSNKPRPKIIEQSRVQSVQRMSLPDGWGAEHVANHYFVWLGRLFNPLVTCKKNEDSWEIRVPLLKRTLLKLSKSEKRSTASRQVFYITGGYLMKPYPSARMEFREHFDHKQIFIAIHDFKPKLPWYVYTFTQAIAHSVVMGLYKRALKKVPST